MGKIYGENLWGKFMGKLYKENFGENVWGNLFDRLVKETVAGQKQVIHICIYFLDLSIKIFFEHNKQQLDQCKIPSDLRGKFTGKIQFMGKNLDENLW